MTKTKTTQATQAGKQAENKFGTAPVWKILIQMAIPSMVLMLVFGAYFFSDSVLSINFASDSYQDGLLSSEDQVRLFMNGYSPINSLMMAVSLLFGIGIATRVSVNLGAGRKDRALNSIKTGTMVGMSIALVMAPILILVAKPWIGSQYDSSISSMVADQAFKYAWPVILSFPLMMFNNIIPSLLRTEARNKEMMVALVLPIFVNLLLDWVFMGPLGMGVEGGAWATFISTALTTILMTFFIYRTKNSMIRFSTLFGFKFQILSVVGIVLVGLAPFLRNIAQSITATVQMGVIKDVSAHVYSGSAYNLGTVQALSASTSVGILKGAMSGDTKALDVIDAFALKTNNFTNHKDFLDVFKGMSIVSQTNSQILALKELGGYVGANIVDVKGHLLPNSSIAEIDKYYQMAQSSYEANFMTLIITGVMPVFFLFFPVMFAFSQAARPIAGYNYGAKNFGRVKQVYWYTVLLALISSVIIYFVVAFGIGPSLMRILHVEGAAYEKAKTIMKIMMFSLIGFSFAIAGMVMAGATDRILWSVLFSSMQGLILFWPVIFTIKGLAMSSDYEFLFWWTFPIMNTAASIAITVVTAFIMKNLAKKDQMTLDERINRIQDAIRNKLSKKSA